MAKNNVNENFEKLKEEMLKKKINAGKDTTKDVNKNVNNNVNKSVNVNVNKNVNVDVNNYVDDDVNKFVIQKTKKSKPSKRITYYLNQETINSIDKYSKLTGMGKSELVQTLLDMALKLQDIGCFGILIEGTKSDIAKDITLKLNIPTIGIGSGVDTDGQILVWSDAFGLNNSFKPKFVREYLNGEELFKNALKNYVKDIKENKFPNENETY